MDLQLRGKIALVTGATAGIGYTVARALLQEGAHVTITGRNEEKLAHAVGVLREDGNGRIEGLVADPATAQGCRSLVGQLLAVAILVNNLGIYESKAFTDITDEEWSHLFEVNVFSAVRLTRSYLPGMLARNQGRVLFISSEAAVVIPPDLIHYAATKTALLSISRGLAETTRGTGVTVNAVLPGPTRSPGIVEFLQKSSSKPAADPLEAETDFFREKRPASLLQRLIEPEEVAHLVAYLASPLSSATNGAALRVDGGLVQTAF